MQKFKTEISPTDRVNGSIWRYFSEISNYSVLTVEEEIMWFAKAKAGDRAAFDKILTSNLKFVVTVAKKYRFRGLELEDLIAEGNKGLIEAIPKFDHTRGTKFITYAVWWICQYIRAAIDEERHLVQLPGSRISSKRLVYNAGVKLEQILCRMPVIAEIAEYTGLSESQIADACADDLCILDVEETVIEDDTFIRADNWLEKKESDLEIRSLLQQLQKKQGEVLNLYYGLDAISAMPIIEIAKLLGVSVQTAQNKKTSGLENLRSDSRFQHFRAYHGG